MNASSTDKQTPVVIVGAGGVMAATYIPLIRSHTSAPLILVELDPAKVLRLQRDYPGATVIRSLDGTGCVPDIAFVLSNTPAHFGNLRDLLRMGCKRMFVEKPVVLNASEAEQLEAEAEMVPSSSIHVAYLMRFSRSVSQLKALMSGFHAEPREIHVEWGKNRTGDKRPTAGALADESVHGMGIIVDLLRPYRPSGLTISARVGFVPYVDIASQSLASSADAFFPASPSSGVSSVIQPVGMPNTIATLRSSFLRVSQHRVVNGAFQAAGDVYLFEIQFDAISDGKRCDHLTVIRASDQSVLCDTNSANNRVADEIEAFFALAEQGEIDERLTTMDAALVLLRITEACERSNADGFSAELVKLQGSVAPERTLNLSVA